MVLNIFKHLLPRAKAWSLTINKRLRQFFDGLSTQGSDFKNYIDLVWLDIFPSTTRYIENWETIFNLPDSGLTEQERRDRLDARWKAEGRQDPKYIQDTLRNAGFDVYVHEWWDPASLPSIVKRDPTAVVTGDSYMLVNIEYGTDFIDNALCGEAVMYCGEQAAICGNVTAGDWKIIEYAPPPDPNDWPFVYYIGGATFPNTATIPASRKTEFEKLLLSISPTQQWIGMLVRYADAIGAFALSSNKTSEHMLHIVKSDGSLIGSHSVGSDVYYNGTSTHGGVQCVFDNNNKAGYFVWRNSASFTTLRILKMDSSGTVSTELTLTAYSTPTDPCIALNANGTFLYCSYLKSDQKYSIAKIETSTMSLSADNSTGINWTNSVTYQRLLSTNDAFLYSIINNVGVFKYPENFSGSYSFPLLPSDITAENDPTKPTIYARTSSDIYKITDSGSSFGTPSSIASGLSNYLGYAELFYWDDKIITSDPITSTEMDLKMYSNTGTLVYTLQLDTNLRPIITLLGIKEDFLYFTARESSTGDYHIYKSKLTSTTIESPTIFINGKGSFAKSQDCFGWNYDKITNAT